MNHPLSLWNSPIVKELLCDFYEANFQKAGVPKELGKKIITYAWENKTLLLEQGGVSPEINALFEEAKQSMKASNEIDPFKLFSWNDTTSLLDIGANKLRRINRIATEYPAFSKLVALDIIPQNGTFLHPEKSIYIQVDDNAINFPLIKNSISLVNIEFVLHHFIDEASIVRMLKNCYSVLQEKGKLLLWEESFIKDANINISDLAQTNNNLGIQTDKNLSIRFSNLTDTQRWEFIIVNDWIINANNPHMPWTGQYRVWEQWEELLNRNGFGLIEEFNLGLRINGLLKQGVHILGLFEKQ